MACAKGFPWISIGSWDLSGSVQCWVQSQDRWLDGSVMKAVSPFSEPTPNKIPERPLIGGVMFALMIKNTGIYSVL